MLPWEREGRDKGENRRNAAFGSGQQQRFPGTGRTRQERNSFAPMEVKRQPRRSRQMPLSARSRGARLAGSGGGLSFNPSAAPLPLPLAEVEEGEE